MRQSLHMAGKYGIVADPRPHELPPEVWTSGKNVRMVDGKVEKSYGDELIVANTGAPELLTFLWGQPIQTATDLIWFVTDNKRAWTTDFSTISNASTGIGLWTGNPDNRFNGGVMGNVLYANNGLDAPAKMTSPALGAQLSLLTNWQAGVTAKVIRPFLNYLICLDVSKSGTRFPQMVKWSSAADPGAEPGSWDETDPTELAGEVNLTEKRGFMVDCLPLGDLNFIYTEDMVYTQRFIQNPFVWDFKPKFRDFGLLGQNCVVEYRNRHLLLTKHDVIAHDGQNWESLLDNRMRRWLIGQIDPARSAQTAYLVVNEYEEELWVCFGRSDDGDDAAQSWSTNVPRQALIIHLKDGTTSFKELPRKSRFMMSSIYDPNAQSQVYNDIDILINQMPGKIGARLYSPGRNRLIGLGAQPNGDAGHIYLADQTYTDIEGNSEMSYVERTGLPLRGQDRSGNPKADIYTRATITEIWPRVEVNPGGMLRVSVGMQEREKGPIVWDGPQNFDPATMEKLDVDVEGRWAAVRFESLDNTEWKLSGYDLEFAPTGEG